MSKSIICPRCGYHLKFNTEICKHCGFSFKDAFEKAKSRDIQLAKVIDEYETALTTGDKLKAYVCLGKLELLNDPKFHLRSGIVLLRDGEYALADDEFVLYKHSGHSSKSPSDISFSEEEKEALPYELENYARSGQLTLFKIVNGGSLDVSLDMYQRLYLQQLAFDNAPDWELRDYFEIKDLEDQKGHVRLSKNDTKDDPVYQTLFLQHLCEDMINMIVFKREFNIAQNRNTEVGEDLTSDDRSEDIILQTKKYGQLLVALPIQDEEGNNPVDRIFKASFEELLSPDFIKWIDDVINAILFDDPNPLPDEPSNYFTYFRCLEKVEAMEIYCRKANRHLSTLLSFSDEFADDIRHIVGTAYFERKSRNLPLKKEMIEYIQNNIDSVSDEMEAEKDRRIYNILSAKGRSAMEVADWEFENSSSVNYGWRDAGPLSLSYFRIIELELNQKLILPLLRNCDVRLIRNCFRKDQERTPTEKRNKFIKTWETHISNLEQVHNPKTERDGLELGWLSYFLGSIVKIDDTLELSTLLKNALFNSEGNGILTEEGFQALNNGTIQDIISPEHCRKYRNPPAHTRYLPYFIAEECREFVRETIIKFGRWFN